MAHLDALEKALELPLTNNLVAYKGDEQKLNAANFSLGGEKTKALAAVFPMTECKKVNLKYNRIDPSVGKFILAKINPRIQELNLEQNMLGRDNSFVDALVQYLDRSDVSLRVLNLNNNGFQDN